MRPVGPLALGCDETATTLRVESVRSMPSFNESQAPGILCGRVAELDTTLLWTRARRMITRLALVRRTTDGLLGQVWRQLWISPRYPLVAPLVHLHH